MNFLARLFGQPGPPPDPESLRRQLFDAGSPRALERLCRKYRDLIREHYDSWRKVPLEIRDKRDQMQAYMHGLLNIAQVFEHRLGDPALMGMLTGPPGSNPLDRWGQRIEEARKLKESLRFKDAAQLLADVLIDSRDLSGSGADTYQAITLGELGECYLQAGEAAKAVAPTRQALDLVQRTEDADGVRAYLGNLYEIHRYLDQPTEAAGYAEQLADHLEKQGEKEESRRYRDQARRVRAGEPRNRVVADIQGHRREIEEVMAGLEGQVRFLFERNKMTLRTAEVLTGQGEQLGSQGKYDEALGLFRDAAAADLHAPHPHYQAAVSLMHLGRAAEAVEEYARTEELAPGWFHCRSELWLARQIVLGKFDHQVFPVMSAVEDGGLPPDRQLQLTDQALQAYPDLAILHHLRGKALRDRGRAAQAIDAWRRGLACAEEPDIRTRLLMDLAGQLDKGDERRQLLEEAVAVGGNLVAQATARLVLNFDS